MSSLTPEDRAYLESRGYRPDDFLKEEIWSVSSGALHGIDLRPLSPVIAFVNKNAAGEVVGIHTAYRVMKDYRYYQHPHKLHYPIVYGTKEDYETLALVGAFCLTEGVFDRIAMKRLLGNGIAVFARLSKGLSAGLTHLLCRYGKVAILAFDQDEAGQAGTGMADLALSKCMDVQVVQMPVKDPADLLKKYGEKRAREIVWSQLTGVTA